MTISAWIAFALSVPVLLFGETLVRRIGLLSRFNIPAPVAGGLIVSLVILLGNIAGIWSAGFATHVSEGWWTWLVSTEPEWAARPAKNVGLPFLVAFFTCVGLNASWTLVKRGSVQVLIFLAICVGLSVLQNGIGVATAKLMGVSPLLGLICGSATMIGGHGTALGFAPEFEKAGLEGASALAAAAATFGLIAGGLTGGPLGGHLIRRHQLRSEAPVQTHLESGAAGAPGFIRDVCSMLGYGVTLLFHALIVLACIKLGAWVSYLLGNAGVTLPVYMGAMLLGVLLRNLSDLRLKWFRTEVIDLIGSVCLAIFLSIAMMSLNLIELANTALPMLVILGIQVACVALFAWLLTFRLMGRDFDAAVMCGGMCGFGLGAVANAIASMKALVENFGPAPRAFMIVPIVGSFLIDAFNALNITIWLNALK